MDSVAYGWEIVYLFAYKNEYKVENTSKHRVMRSFLPNNIDLTDRSILITGGTGSFGKRCVETLIRHYNPKRIVVYSRDELKQYEMEQSLSQYKPHPVRFFIGDIRDHNRLNLALRNIDIVIHAAALKQVPTAEYNPMVYSH